MVIIYINLTNTADEKIIYCKDKQPTFFYLFALLVLNINQR